MADLSLTDYALIVFGAGALLGLFMASIVLTGKLAPWPVSLLHAALGATGLVLLLLAVLGGAGQRVLVALVILAITALGGFFLASFHARRKPAPGIVVIIHALAALAGVIVLGLVVFEGYLGGGAGAG